MKIKFPVLVLVLMIAQTTQAAPKKAADSPLAIYPNQLSCDQIDVVRNDDDDGPVTRVSSTIKLYDTNGKWTGKSWVFTSPGSGDYGGCADFDEFRKNFKGKFLFNENAMSTAASSMEGLNAARVALLTGSFSASPSWAASQEPTDSEKLDQLNKKVAQLSGQIAQLRKTQCANVSCAKSTSHVKTSADQPDDGSETKGMQVGSMAP